MISINYKRYVFKKIRAAFAQRKKRFRYFIKKYYQSMPHYVRNKFVYFPIYWRISIDFYATISYNAYQAQFFWLKYKYNNIKYHLIVSDMREANKLTRMWLKPLYIKYAHKRLEAIWDFLYLYNYFFFAVYIDLFYFLKAVKRRKIKTFYYLTLSFTKNRLFVNLQNSKKKKTTYLYQQVFLLSFLKKKNLLKKIKPSNF